MNLATFGHALIIVGVILLVSGTCIALNKTLPSSIAHPWTIILSILGGMTGVIGCILHVVTLLRLSGHFSVLGVIELITLLVIVVANAKLSFAKLDSKQD